MDGAQSELESSVLQEEQASEQASEQVPEEEQAAGDEHGAEGEQAAEGQQLGDDDGDMPPPTDEELALLVAQLARIIRAHAAADAADPTSSDSDGDEEAVDEQVGTRGCRQQAMAGNGRHSHPTDIQPGVVIFCPCLLRSPCLLSPPDASRARPIGIASA